MGKEKGLGIGVIGLFLLILALVTPWSIVLAIIVILWGISEYSKKEPEYRPPSRTLSTDQETVFCGNCGTENVAVARACRGCGKSLEIAKTETQPSGESIYCVYCGAQNNSLSSDCVQCGKRLPIDWFCENSDKSIN